MKKLLSLLFLGSLTLTACGGGAGAKVEEPIAGATEGTGSGNDYTDYGPGAWDGTATAAMNSAFEEIDGKDMLTDMSKHSDYAYNHMNTVSRILAYKDYYKKMDIGDLVTSISGEYADYGTQITSTSNVILSSQGGPTRLASPTYFDMTTMGDASGGNTATDGGFETSIDNAVDTNVSPLWNNGSNGEDLFMINVKQSQVLHNDDAWLQTRYQNKLLTDAGFDAAFAHDMNLRSVAIFETVSEYFENKNTDSLNVITHSFGSVLMPLWQGTMGWLNYQENNKNRFDNISIVAGRLEMPQGMIDCAVTGSLTSYRDAGLGDGSQVLNTCGVPTEDQDMINDIQDMINEGENHEDFAGDPVWKEGDTLETMFNKFRSNFLMQGAFGTLDYTMLFDEYSGSYNNTDYWHGGVDTATGRLTSKENTSINKHYRTNNFYENDGHGVNSSINVFAADSMWSKLEVKRLRTV